jgi:TPR repeat protein
VNDIIKRVLLLFFLLLAQIGHAQPDDCYTIGFNAGTKEYAQGEKHLSDNKYEQALASFKEAKGHFVTTKENCRNPNTAALNEWIKKCDNAIQRVNGVVREKTDADRRAREKAEADRAARARAEADRRAKEREEANRAAKAEADRAKRQQEADPYATGEKYYNEKNYTKAIKWYRKSAEQGNAKGQWKLSHMYHNGYDVTQDYSEVIKWYRKSAEQGNALAQYSLGFMYEFGKGVTEDLNEAIKWYRKSIDGSSYSSYRLGIMYETGKGVTKDHKEAIKWYRKSVEQGNPIAKINLESLELKEAQLMEAQMRGAQKGKVSGTVRYRDGEPIAGVSVTVEGSTIDTVTAIEGDYTISVPADATLVFAFLGCNRKGSRCRTRVR